MTEILADSKDTLRGIAQQYLGDFTLALELAEFNNIGVFDELVGLKIQIPTNSELEEIKATLIEQTSTVLSEFERLEIESINNWQSLRWL